MKTSMEPLWALTPVQAPSTSATCCNTSLNTPPHRVASAQQLTYSKVAPLNLWYSTRYWLSIRTCYWRRVSTKNHLSAPLRKHSMTFMRNFRISSKALLSSTRSKTPLLQRNYPHYPWWTGLKNSPVTMTSSKSTVCPIWKRPCSRYSMLTISSNSIWRKSDWTSVRYRGNYWILRGVCLLRCRRTRVIEMTNLI